jgi:cobalt-precorrin 5A hydrolase
MIVAGFGFRSVATVDSLKDALQSTGILNVDAIATAHDKAETTAFITFAKIIGALVIPIMPDTLEATQTPTQSLASQSHRATGSVAEAAALSAVGKGAKLLATRSISNDRMATCAIAQGSKI